MNRGLLLRIDWGILIPTFILLIISLTTLFSIHPTFFKNQLISVGISLIIFFIFSQVDYRAMRVYAFPIYVFSVFILCFVLFLGIESRGAVRWIDVFGFRIQFSEILKPFIAVWLASFLYQKNTSLYTFIVALAFLSPIIFLILIQPDLGSALIYLFSIAMTLLIVGFPFSFFIMGGVLGILAAPILWIFLHEYQRHRIMTFINPTSDPLGTSYNVIQSIIAVGSGMFWGKGLGEATQSGLRFLPERHTDFIFATLSEGLGFVGASIVILASGWLLYRIYTIFLQTTDQFCKIFVAFSFSLLLVQFFINVAMNVGILPVVGVTLPFVSYGGSSLVSNFILLGLLSAASSATRHDQVLEIR